MLLRIIPRLVLLCFIFVSRLCYACFRASVCVFVNCVAVITSYTWRDCIS